MKGVALVNQFVRQGWMVCRMLAMLLLLASLPAGCAPAGWIAHGVAGGKRKYNIEAEYLGLHDKSVAVLVAADPYVLYQHPRAPDMVSRALSRELVDKIPTVTITNPDQVQAYVKEHPHWTTAPYSELIAGMGVDRLLIVDLGEYRTNEPGNAHLWHGVISAHILVVEREARHPDNAAYSQHVVAMYPEGTTVGVVNADPQTIQLGMLVTFARDTVRLFHNHQIEQ